MSICAKKDYEVVDEETQNVYNIAIVKEVLKDAIENSYNWSELAAVAKIVFSYENQIVRFWDDDGFGLAYPKDDDKMQEHLAKMAMRNIERSE